MQQFIQNVKSKKVLALSIWGISDYGLMLVIPRFNRLDSINPFYIDNTLIHAMVY